MDNTILLIAIAATLVFAIYTLIASFTGDHHAMEGQADVGDGFGILQFFSIQSMLLAIMSYSWSWLFWSKDADGTTLPVLATLASGTAMVAFYVFGMRSLRKLNSSDVIEQFSPEIGMHATVYSTIPPCDGGHGVITFMCPKRGDFEINATSTSQDPIATGSKVVVAELNLPSNVIVRLA